MSNQIRLHQEGWSVGIGLRGATVLDWCTPTGQSLFMKPEPGLEEHYVGCVLGRFSRIVREGRFEIDGVRQQLDRNAGRHHVHGGRDSFSRRLWRIVDRTHNMIQLELVSEDGDQGYPGRCRAQVRYFLEAGRLTTTFQASVDKATLCDLILHPFFPLTRGGAEASTLDLGVVQKLVQSRDLVPTGIVEQARRVVLDLDKDRIDDYFVPSRRPWTVLLGVGKYDVSIESDQPGVAVYTGDNLPQPRSGICVQASAWPDAPNIDGAPSAIVRPGEEWTSTTRYTVTRRSNTRSL